MPITKSTNCRNITISNIITRSNVPATKSTNCRNIKCCHLYTYSCFIVTIIIKLQKLNENENVGPLLDQHCCSIFYFCTSPKVLHSYASHTYHFLHHNTFVMEILPAHFTHQSSKLALIGSMLCLSGHLTIIEPFT